MRRFLALLVFSSLASAQTFGLSVFLGFTANASTDLKVVQEGHPDTVVSGARFEGQDLQDFPYYAVRLWYGDPAGLRYELELIHQKIVFAGAAQNGEILEEFRSTDGFNYVLFNLAYALDTPVRVVPRVGVGVIIPHPETVVRGRRWGNDGDPGGYHFGGFGAQAAVGLEMPWVLSPALEGKVTVGYSRLNIAGGYAEGLFGSLHGLFGVSGRLP